MATPALPAAVTYPDGSQLVSNALTLSQINNVLFNTTVEMLGWPSITEFVRIAYPPQGAPFQLNTDNGVYIACLLRDEPYDKIRDKYNWPAGFGSEPFGSFPYGDNVTILEQWNYTRCWDIRWVIYGPNSSDNARIIRSALYQDYFTQFLQKYALFPVSEISEAIRVPETFAGQWWERVDLHCDFYEYVTETVQRATVASVEVIVEVPQGQIADVTVYEDAYGGSSFGGGDFGQ